ncbi:MAG: CRISPR-associated ring nuclease [Chloroflexota bacterium]
MNQSQGTIMIATLGGQPQVVTFALDALLARGEDIRELIVLYLSDEGSRVNQALARLSAEFADDQYDGRPCRLRPLPIRSGGRRVPDIRAENDAIATWEMLRDLLTTLKSEQRQLHVCVSGGRRMMGLLMVSVALLHFGYRDKLWHIYTPDPLLQQVQEGAIMHARPEDGVRLIEVPLVPLGLQFPALQSLVGIPPDTVSRPRLWLDQAEQKRCETVAAQLTQRQLEALRAFAAGLAPQQVADRLGITLNTVNSHKKVILDLCRNTWPEQEPIRYYHLREWFGPYFGLF